MRSPERFAISLSVLGLIIVWLRAHLVDIGDMLPLDDAWIHAAFARNLAQNGKWGLLFAESSPGETSPLWAPILSLAELGSLSDAALFSLLLGGASFILLIVICSTLGPHGRMAAIALALCGPLLFHATSGMETVPYLLLGIGSLVAYSRQRSLLAALLAGAAAWFRLDAIVLLVMLWIGESDERRAGGKNWPKAFSEALRVIAPGLLLWLGALTFLSLMEGDFPPATLAGRRWLVGQPSDWSFATVGAGSRAFLRDWSWALSADLGFGHFSTHFLGDLPGLSALVRHGWKILMASVLAIGLFRIVTSAVDDRRRTAERLLLLWALWTIIEYAVLLPSRGHGGRYQVMLYPALLWTASAGLCWLWRGGGWRRRAAWVAGLWIGLGLFAGWWEAGRLRTLAAQHLSRVHDRAATDWGQKDEPELLAAAFDVGLLAYRNSGPWLDISGLADAEVAGKLQERRLGQWLAEKGATHVFVPIQEDDGAGSMRDRLGLLESDGVLLEMEAVYESPGELWGDAFLFSGNVLRRLILYRVVALP